MVLCVSLVRGTKRYNTALPTLETLDFFFDGDGGDSEFEDSGASIEVSPINTTSSDQEVNQAASAFGR
jgi:hypothetical protein